MTEIWRIQNCLSNSEGNCVPCPRK